MRRTAALAAVTLLLLALVVLPPAAWALALPVDALPGLASPSTAGLAPLPRAGRPRASTAIATLPLRGPPPTPSSTETGTATPTRETDWRTKDCWRSFFST